MDHRILKLLWFSLLVRWTIGIHNGYAILCFYTVFAALTSYIGIMFYRAYRDGDPYVVEERW